MLLAGNKAQQTSRTDNIFVNFWPLFYAIDFFLVHVTLFQNIVCGKMSFVYSIIMKIHCHAIPETSLKIFIHTLSDQTMLQKQLIVFQNIFGLYFTPFLHPKLYLLSSNIMKNHCRAIPLTSLKKFIPWIREHCKREILNDSSL